MCPSGGEEARKALKEWERGHLIARSGSSKWPRLVDLTTDLPNVPEIQKSESRKPKLNNIQLIALAIINHEGRLPTGCDILSWIRDHFPYFAGSDRAYLKLEVRMMQLFDEYDPPIMPLTANSNRLATGGMADDFWRCRFAMVIGHLASVFPANPGVFPFLNLPSELRVKIYEYALSFPCDAWIICRKPSLKRRPNSLLTSAEVSRGIVGKSSRSPPLNEVLALLLVNKQIFIEAVPIFYRQHRFLLTADSPELPRHSPTMGIDRCNYLRDIIISYVPGNALPSTWFSIFQMLRNFQELKRLTLTIHSYDNWSYTPDVSQWPGFDALSLVRGLQELVVVARNNFHQGVFSSILVHRAQGYLEPLLTQPRADPFNVRITRAMQKKVQFANVPLQPGLPDTTRKRKKSRQSGQEQRGGEGFVGGGEKRQRKQQKTYHSRSPTPIR